MSNPSHSTRRRRLLQSALATVALAPFSRSFATSPGYPRLMEGPMLGPPTPESLTIWVRTSGALPVEVEYDTDSLFRNPRRTAPVQSRADMDFTARLVVPGLRPATRYFYRVRVDGGVDRYRREPFVARTAPVGRAAFRVAFGSCARHQLDAEQAIFRAVAALEPDLFFWLGDNIYADSAEPAVFAEDYRRQRSIASLQPLLRSVPHLATWDDHDFGLNDADRTQPARAAALDAFHRYWANPSFGIPGTPGVFFEYAYGGVDFFFLDGRYYRDPNAGPDGPAKTMLGSGQKAWLESALKASRAPFKVLVSGSGWSSEDGPAGDTWAAFLTERNALFDFIRDQRIPGVFGLSGDTHYGELNCIPWSQRGGYDFYDLVSTPLAASVAIPAPQKRPEMRMRPAYSRSCNFGLLDFRWEPHPRVTFTLRDDRGDRVWDAFELTPAELENGRATWRDKIDPAELARQRAFIAS